MISSTTGLELIIDNYLRFKQENAIEKSNSTIATNDERRFSKRKEKKDYINN